jgi:hypothetical protein
MILQITNMKIKSTVTTFSVAACLTSIFIISSSQNLCGQSAVFRNMDGTTGSSKRAPKDFSVVYHQLSAVTVGGDANVVGAVTVVEGELLDVRTLSVVGSVVSRQITLIPGVIGAPDDTSLATVEIQSTFYAFNGDGTIVITGQIQRPTGTYTPGGVVEHVVVGGTGVWAGVVGFDTISNHLPLTAGYRLIKFNFAGKNTNTRIR